jgi:MFS transporter, DHA3 family, macrolide efflux protein
MASTPSHASLAALVRNRSVQALLTAGVLTQVGIWVRNFALLLFVVEQTGGDALAVSLISVAEYAPILLFSLIGGTFADRWPPKRTMLWCALVSAVSMFGLGLALLGSTWQVVFCAMLISASVSQCSQPAGMKLLRVHVPEAQRQAGMALWQMMIAAFMMVGPLVGTFIFQQCGIYLSMAAVGGAFLGSALVLTCLPADRLEPPARAPALWHAMRLGVHYLWAHPLLRTLGGGFMATGLALGLTHPLAIFLVTERLGLAEQALQWLFAAHGAAMLIGGGVVLGYAHRCAPHVLVLLGMGAMAAGLCMKGPVRTVHDLSSSGSALSHRHAEHGPDVPHACQGGCSGVKTPLFARYVP